MSFYKKCTQLKALPDFSVFQFISQGIAGSTTRQVRFINQREPNIYNLELGDLDPQSQQSGSISDNGDMNKVIATLMLIIELYTERYPMRTVRLKGNTKEKARLYRIALDIHVNHLLPLFDIGLEEEKHHFFQKFRGREPLDNIAFLLKRKPGLCFTLHTIQTTLTSHSLLFGNPVSVELHRNIQVGVVSVGSTN